MKKLTKGALTMVLAGAVTFSVTNALLATPPAKQLKEKIASTISGDRKIVDVTKEKTVEEQTPTSNVKDRQTKIAHNIDSFQVALKNESDRSIAANQQNTKESITNPAKANATTTTTPAEPTIPATSTKATTPTNTSTTPTSTTSPTTTGSNTPSTTTTPSNYGQQVSQAAKEKAASRQDSKENNGKKM